MSETDNQIFCKCGNGSFYVRNDEVLRLICTKCQETMGITVGVSVVVKTEV